MGDHSDIEWTEATWNPLAGCAYASPGCRSCYAAQLVATRLKNVPAYEGLAIRSPGEPAKFTGEIRTLPDRLEQPLRWRRPRMIFVNSMSDLFHRDVPYEFIMKVFAVMACAPQHTFQVLTKRPQRMATVLNNPTLGTTISRVAQKLGLGALPGTWPLPNVWLGTSIESDRYAFRADDLLNTTAGSVRFLSIEPLLGPVPSIELEGIDWVIAGGESGSGARPMHPNWVRDLRDRCVTSGIPFFFKQWGEWVPDGQQTSPPLGLFPARERRLVHPTPGEVVPITDGVVANLVGKKAAGRDLDGRKWDEIPEVAT